MFTIGVCAAQLGIPAATLRKWESRYGCPRPLRTEAGTRLYRAEDLAQLREVKRLLDAGMQPARAFQLLPEQCASAISDMELSQPAGLSEPLASLWPLLLQDRFDLLRQHLQAHLRTLGIRDFAERVATPLMEAVGEAWATGDLPVFREHAVAAVMAGVLEDAYAPFATTEPAPGGVLLTTPAGEQHGLGRLALKSMLAATQVPCVDLGASLPVDQLVAAVADYRPAVVALSISRAYTPRHAARYLSALRAHLPAEVAIWVGGQGARALLRVPFGVDVFASASDALAILRPAGPFGAGSHFNNSTRSHGNTRA